LIHERATIGDLLLGAASLFAVYNVTSNYVDVEPPPSSANLPETELPDTTAKDSISFPVPASRDDVTLLTDRPTKEPTTTSLPPRPLQVAIHETSKDNGTFYTAQEIIEGVIIGRRSMASDHTDYYKVRATGHTMILRLEPSLIERNHRFIMTVYDADRRSIREDLGVTGSTITLAVTSQAIYYIKIDLRHAPIETPQYQLHMHFK